MSNVISIASHKGGIGKTATALSLAHGLAERGNSVLLVDINSQSDLTYSIGVETNDCEGKSIYTLLVEEERGKSTHAMIRKTAVENVDLIPSELALAFAEPELMQAFNRESALEAVLLPISETYDYVIIDCPHNLGILTINALRASQHIIIPVQCDLLAVRGATMLMRLIKKVQTQLNPDLDVLGLVPTMYDPRTRHSEEALRLLKVNFKQLVFESIIPYTVKAKDATGSRKSVLEHAPSSDIAKAYRKLTEEVEARLAGEPTSVPEPRESVAVENV